MVVLFNGGISAVIGYLPTPGGMLLGILPIYTFSSVQKRFFHVLATSYTSRGHSFTSHPKESTLEVSFSLTLKIPPT